MTNEGISPLRRRMIEDMTYGATLGHKDLPEGIPYARRRKTLPMVLSPKEVATFLEAVESRRDRVAFTSTDGTPKRSG